jgi:hypothetical protein
MRVLDVVTAAGSSEQVMTAVADVSELAQRLSQKETKQVLHRDLSELMSKQAELMDLLRGVGPAADGASDGYQPLPDMVAMALLLMKAATPQAEGAGAQRPAQREVAEPDESPLGLDDGGFCMDEDMENFVLTPPNSDSWEWPMSRLEIKERVLASYHMEMKMEMEELLVANDQLRLKNQHLKRC